ncbi:MAG: ABC transporter substrate-binding protein [Deltaproteobacteria bacterium]|nr:ABC transporter substrate-binding protein [Deltaproteobacteria bacterium]
MLKNCSCRKIGFGLVLFFLFLNTASPLAAGPPPLKKVTFIPQWVPQAQFAGYYVALETGIYQEHGLDVEIISGGPQRSSADYLANKKADFASLWLVTALDLCNQGIKVVNLAQIVQRSALMLVAKKSSGILKPTDLEGRKVGLWGSPFAIQPEAFFKQYGLTVEPLQQSYSINLFLRDGVDVASAMWYNEYHSLLNAGINPEELTTFFYYEHGLNYPEDGLYVLQQTRQQQPELCRAFVAASLKGWRRAFAEPELALDIIMRNLKKEHVITNRIHQKWMLERMRDIILPPAEELSLGRLKEEDFHRVAASLISQNIIDTAPNFNEFHHAQTGE